VAHAEATLEHIQPISEGGNSHQDNLAISHDRCNNLRHAKGKNKTQTATQTETELETKAAA
jgi:5-methylcytosine-specific restriction endonuclease McrA